MNRHGRGFASGMLLGAVLSLVTALAGGYLLMAMDVVSVSVVDLPGIQAAGDWLRRNLGLSVIPFALTLALYTHNLRTLSRRLAEGAAPNEVGQLEHLLDVWTSLFFGIGVIWTAIGMRSALIYAVGDPTIAAQAGAFAILARMVDGGILTALTTTIVGGVGGYLMRVVKSSCLGTRLNRYYEEQEQRYATRVEDLLRDIRAALGSHRLLEEK
jgi:hypothetical protein